MTEFNNNKYVPKAPKTFQVVELKEATIKRSSLSAAARAKVVQRYGSNYLSENQEGYGPCTYCNPQCSCFEKYGYAPLYMSCPSCENRTLMV